MKAIRFVGVIGACSGLCLVFMMTSILAQGQPELRPVLVELFTSAGCSNCPPAERAVEFLRKQQPVTNIEIITLAFHVDYWDTTVWRDPLASPIYTRRQDLYGKQFKLDSVYTPQVIVQGKTAVVGADMNRVISAVQEVSKTQLGKIDGVVTAGEIDISISGLPPHQAATVYLAVVQDKLPAVSFSGEQRSGDSVVRQLAAISAVEEGQYELKLNTQLPANNVSKQADVSYVVFVQNNMNRRVLAVKKMAPIITSVDHKG